MAAVAMPAGQITRSDCQTGATHPPVVIIVSVTSGQTTSCVPMTRACVITKGFVPVSLSGSGVGGSPGSNQTCGGGARRAGSLIGRNPIKPSGCPLVLSQVQPRVQYSGAPGGRSGTRWTIPQTTTSSADVSQRHRPAVTVS